MRGDLKREDLVVGEDASRPSYRFSLACRSFGLRRDPLREEAFDTLLAQPTPTNLASLLRLCHVACAEVWHSRHGDVVEIYSVGRQPVQLRLRDSDGEWLIRVDLKPGYDTDYMLTPESVAALVHSALRNN